MRINSRIEEGLEKVMLRLALYILAALSLQLVFSGMAYAYSYKGPFEVSSNSIFSLNRATIEPKNSAAISKTSIYLSKSLINAWGKSDDYLIDYELWVTKINLKTPINRSFDCNFIFLIADNGTDLLDAPIHDFHNLFGLNQNDRDRHPYGENAIDLGDGNLIKGHGTIRSVKFKADYSFRGFVFSLSYSSSYENSIVSDSMWLEDNAGLSVQSFSYLRGMIFYYGFGYSYDIDESDNIIAGVPYFSGFLSWEWEINHNTSVVLQVMGMNHQDREHHPLNKTALELLGGLKFHFDTTIMEIAVIENGPNFRNSPDFGLHFAVKSEIY